MLKKSLTMLSIFCLIIFTSTFVFATNIVEDTKNAVEDVGNGIRDMVEDTTNTAEDAKNRSFRYCR